MGPGRFAGVGLVGTLKGIIVAIIVSIVALAYQVADPPAYVLGMPGTNLFRQRAKEYPEDETIPGLLMLRLEGRFFFVNASQIAQKIKPLIEEFQPKVGAIHLSGVPDLEHRVENADRGRSATARPWHGRRAGGNEPPSATDVENLSLVRYWGEMQCYSIWKSLLRNIRVRLSPPSGTKINRKLRSNEYE